MSEEDIVEHYRDPNEVPEILYNFAEDKVVTICHCGPGMYLGINTDAPTTVATNVKIDDDETDDKDDAFVNGQWDASSNITDKRITCIFRSRKTGKYLTIHEDGKVNVDGIDTQTSTFHVKWMGDTVALESHDKYLCVKKDGKTVTTADEHGNGDVGSITFQIINCNNPQPKEYEEKTQQSAAPQNRENEDSKSCTQCQCIIL